MMVGLMARFMDTDGYGFIECPDCEDKWGKIDIYVADVEFKLTDASVRDWVKFKVRGDRHGRPRAEDIVKLKELTKVKKQLQSLQDVANIMKCAPASSAPPPKSMPPKFAGDG